MEFKEILIWLFIFVIGSLIVSAIIDPSIFTGIKNQFNYAFKQPIKEESITDPLINECLVSFDKCKDTATTKYNSISINILQIEKFENDSNAKIFYEKWSNPMQKILSIYIFGEYYDGYEIEEKLNYPIVLIATNTKAEEENPVVAICNSNGELTKFTKQLFLC